MDHAAEPKISCIICAYNEEKAILHTLSAVASHPQIDEVIVVDDGSSDGTPDIVRVHEGVQAIVHPHNKGKSAALATGLTAASNDYILLLDADLVGLTSDAVSELLEPVLTGVADVSISIRTNSLPIYKAIGLDFVSGERVFPKALLQNRMQEVASLPRYGFEVFLNRIFIEQNVRLAVVPWKNVINLRKKDKIGFWKGNIAEFKMIGSVLKTVSMAEVIRQNYRLISQRVRRSKVPDAA